MWSAWNWDGIEIELLEQARFLHFFFQRAISIEFGNTTLSTLTKKSHESTLTRVKFEER